MNRIQKNLKFNMRAVVNESFTAELKLCNIGSMPILIPGDTILLNGMYRKFPFNLSGDLNSKCEVDSSGYKEDSMKLLPHKCISNTWYLDRECDFRDVHGNYTLEFRQDIECNDTSGSDSVVLGDQVNFLLP